MAYLAWWGGFFFGPLAGAAVALVEPKGSLNRAHGIAAAVAWCVLLAFWTPFTFWVIILGQADPNVLLVGAPIAVGFSLVGCVVGTVQAARGRSLLGQRMTS